MMPLVCAYCPVRKLARLGEQSGVVANAFVNLAPSRASRSMCGVSMNGWPTLRISSQRMSSTSTTTMLGRRDGAADDETFCGVMSGRLQAPDRSATANTKHCGVPNAAFTVMVNLLTRCHAPIGIPCCSDRRQGWHPSTQTSELHLRHDESEPGPAARRLDRSLEPLARLRLVAAHEVPVAKAVSERGDLHFVCIG